MSSHSLSTWVHDPNDQLWIYHHLLLHPLYSSYLWSTLQWSPHHVTFSWLVQMVMYNVYAPTYVIHIASCFCDFRFCAYNNWLVLILWIIGQQLCFHNCLSCFSVYVSHIVAFIFIMHTVFNIFLSDLSTLIEH